MLYREFYVSTVMNSANTLSLYLLLLNRKLIWFILQNFSEWGQFGITKVGNNEPYIFSIIPVIRISNFNIGCSV